MGLFLTPTGLSTTERQSLSSRERQRIEDALERRIKSDQAMISYQKELASRGVGGGGIFQEEGPGLGESPALLEEIKLLGNLPGSRGEDGNLSRLAKLKIQKLREQEERGGLSSQFGTSTREDQKLSLGRGLGAALQDVLDYAPDSMASPFTIGEKKAQQASRDVDASRIEAMPEDSSVFQSPMDAISAQIEKASLRPLVGSSRPDTQSIIAANKIEEAGDQENAQGIIVANPTDKDEDPVETAFVEGMNPYLDALNKKIPTANNREELLEKYKKEFSEATGIEIDGKVDKSQALMAMGLSLMQNRAGKGFNVGKLLNAVGVAGDAAMPYLREATKEAKAAKVAAGKYALDKIASGESAAAALSEERRVAARAFNLEMYKLEADLKKERIKAGAKGVEYENVKAIEPVKDLDIHYGTTKDGRTVLAKAAGDAGRLASKFNAYSKAQVILNGMEASLEEIANNKSPTLDKVTAKINGLLVGFGLKDAQVTFGDSKISPEDQVAKARQTLINEFKRALLQESQVSDLDLKGLFDSLGDQGIFENPNVPIEAIKNMRGYFGNKKADLEPVILQFRDDYFYRNEDEFNKVQEVLDNAFIKKYQTKGVAKKDRTFVDLTEQGDV